MLKYKIPLAILGLIGASIIFLLTSRHGTGISPDSVAYISVARHIASGAGFITYDGYYFVLQPPLYPILLAAIKELLLIDPLTSAGYVNAILFGLIVYFSGLFFLKKLNSFTLVVMGTVSVLISYALVQVSLMAWSEPLFILLTLLYLYYFETYQAKGDITSLILLSASAALACLTRYIGVVIILTGVVNILLQRKNIFKEKLRHIIIFLLITVLPLGVWIIRNYFLSGTLIGQRAVSSYTLSENMKFLLNTVLPWYLPGGIRGQYVIFWILTAVAVISVGIGLMKRWDKKVLNLKQISPTLIFVLFYVGIIVISSTTTAYDHIDNRLLSPIYVPATFILFFGSDKILTWLQKKFSPKLITVLFAAAIVMLMTFPVRNTIYIVNDYIEQSGWEYNSKPWRDSETIQYLIKHRSLETGFTFYSNAPEAVYILANIETMWSPAKTMYNSPQLLSANSKLNSNWQGDGKVCLVWFNKIDRDFLFTINELQKNTKMAEIAHFQDGEIYTFTEK